MNEATVDYQTGCIAANLEEVQCALDWLTWQVGEMSSERVDAFDKLFDDTVGAAYRAAQQAIITRQGYWTEQEWLAKEASPVVVEVVVAAPNNAHDRFWQMRSLSEEGEV